MSKKNRTTCDYPETNELDIREVSANELNELRKYSPIGAFLFDDENPEFDPNNELIADELNKSGNIVDGKRYDDSANDALMLSMLRKKGNNYVN